MMREEVTIFDFNKTSNRKQWDLVNDEVMGGISMGLLQIDDDGNGVFSGHVSLENNGGFCLIKHDINRISVEKYSSFVIKLKGDGKNYAFRCKSGEHQRHTYSYSFKTTKDWQTIQIPFKEMEAVFRGDNLELPNYHGDFLAQIAFIIKNGVAEDFTLKIDSIKIV
ncbi:Complex I intermediate-associated protein 30 (CIA30) [Maribacter dokdonensis]|uniref:Complex I intermediate-associated protein 30 (CIA30) n=1 Tax=Maribacter dokdonensis TaxID=320912 RepID=A0ABY0U7B8_9FLAO|nr:CIA30 family protein [Maribacter dokdonensis]SDS18471.1 Complex I intermediate-associated protein 30 (CIA30) [Maribacter dokdonensis]